MPCIAILISTSEKPLFLPIIAYTLSTTKIRDKGKIVSAGYWGGEGGGRVGGKGGGGGREEK